VKKALVLLILVAAAFLGGALWMKHCQTAPAAEHAAGATASAEKEAGGPQVSRDTNGNVVITINEKTRKELGIEVAKLEPFQMSPELKAYGRVLDPAPLAALMTELAAAQAAQAASSSELARLKTLEAQGNASARAMQTAQATAVRDQVAVESIRERITLAWGKAVADQNDLPAFARLLASQEAALVRIDLPVGEALKEPPASARIDTLAGQSAEARYVGPATSVDPDVQGQAFIFLLKPNALRLAPGQSVVGYVGILGAPVSGVIIPRDAIVRAEGAGWVYVLNSAGDALTRVRIALDRAVGSGWFVNKSVTATDSVAVTGVQQLLSFEVRSAGGTEE
jgi:hypothetical protein